MLRSYKIGSRPFDTFASGNFLRLARSCRVVEKFDKNHRFFVIFCRSGPEKRSIGSDFSATRHDLGKRRKAVSPNILNFMMPRLERLSPSERREMLVIRSDFAEKQHNLALGSRSGRISPQLDKISANGEKTLRAMYWTSWCPAYSVWVHRGAEKCLLFGQILLKKLHNLALGSQESTITEQQMVGGLWESKVRCIDTIPNTSRYHGGMGADKNCTGPEKAWRVRETACWHYRNNFLGWLSQFFTQH